MPMPNNAPTLEDVMQRLANEKEESPGRDMGLSWVIAKNLLRLFSIIFRVLFLRSRFGERYMQAYHVAGSWFIVAFVVAGTSLSSVELPWAGGSANVTTIGVLFLVAYSAMLALRYYGVLRRRWANDFSQHSYSEGSSWELWRKLRLSPSLIGLVIEPLLVVSVGSVLGYALEFPALRVLAWVGAIAHFVEQNIIGAQERAKLLDAADNLIEQRLAEERLGKVRGGQQPTRALVHHPVADQAALRRELEQVRAQATAAGGE